MADEKLSWFFELIDRVTGPSQRMTKALGVLKTAIGESLNGGRMGKMLSRLPPVFQKAAFGMVHAFGGPFGQKLSHIVTSGMRQAGSAIASGGAFLARGLGGALSLLGGAGAIGAGLGAVGAAWAASSLAFKENTLIAFETILGSADAAKRVMANAVAFAAATPFETKDVIGNYQKLLVAGFKESEVNVVMAGAGELGAANPGQGKDEQAIRAFQKIMGHGKLMGDSMDMLADAGIKVDLVYENLGKVFGTTADGARKLQAAGKIDAKTGILAALNAIKDTLSGGELGSMMAKQSKSLSGLWSSLTSRPFELLIAADAEGATGGLRAFLKDVSDALDPEGPTGKRIVGLLNTVGAAFGHAFGEAGKGRGVATSLNAILNVLEPLVGAFAQFGGGMFSGLMATLKPLMDVFVMLSGDSGPAGFAKAMARAGEVLGVVLGVVALGFGTITAAVVGVVAAVGWGWEQIQWFWTHMGEFGGALVDIGKQLVLGFINGITGGIVDLAPAIYGLGTAAIAGLKNVLGIHSPSKAFEQLGIYSAEGYIQGLEKGDLHGAMNDNATPPSFGPRPTSGTSGAAMNVGGVTVTVNINGADAQDHAAITAKVEEGVESALVGAFQRMMLQTGS